MRNSVRYFASNRNSRLFGRLFLFYDRGAFPPDPLRRQAPKPRGKDYLKLLMEAARETFCSTMRSFSLAR